MSPSDIPPAPHPPLNIPPSTSTVSVSILDTTTNMVVPASGFVEPVIPGHEHLNLPTFSFHITHRASGRQILFDLGSRKDWWNFSPATLANLKKVIPALHVEKNVSEILEEGGVGLDGIEAAVLSHWHWDHTGDPSLFPPSTALVVGPGFKANFMPGHPSNPSGVLLDADFRGRAVHEISFSPSFKIGAFEAHDYFGDGSFYVLNVPGHAIGHVSGLARVSTGPDSFVFMGGDVCHFGGSFRPTPFAPLPAEIPASVPLGARFRMPCPCSLFTACHPAVTGADDGTGNGNGNGSTLSPSTTASSHASTSTSNTADAETAARTTPYYTVTTQPGSWYVDPPTAQTSIDALEAFDAAPEVLVCIAHDEGLRDVVRWFPHGTLDAWREEGWKESARWGFLGALPRDGKPGKGWMVEGLMRDGRVVDPGV